MTEIIYAPLAEKDLEDIAIYIALDNPKRALSFVDELITKINKIAQNPKSFISRSDLGKGLRSAVYGRYVIFYREIENGIYISRVLHSARNAKRLLDTE